MVDRGRETSNALTEVRTVLSRAETALDYIVHGPTEGHTEYDENHHYVGFHREFDPDHEEMEEALRQCVMLLSRWRRTGRPKR